MRTAYGAGWRFTLFLIVIVACAIGPLFIVHRAKCVEDGKRVESWSLVAPWDEPSKDCTGDETGFEVLKEKLGF